MRIAILTFESPQANAIIERLLRERPGQICGIMRSAVIVSGKTAPQALWFLARRTGLGFVVRKGAQVLMTRFRHIWSSIGGTSANPPSLTEMTACFGVPLVDSGNVNAPAELDILRAWRPDLIISVYLNQLMRPPLIALPPLGVINVHGGRLPENRGLFPYFWALANGDDEAGVAVHWVDPQLDTGDILLEQRFAVQDGDTVNSLAWKTAHIGADLLMQATRLIEAGDPPHRPQDPAAARYFSWPTRADVRRLRQRGRRYGFMFDDRTSIRLENINTCGPQPARRSRA